MKKRIIKILNISMCLVFTIYSLFGALLTVKADETFVGRTTTDLNVRSAPTKDNNPDGSNNKIGELNANALITVLSREKIKGNGCDGGWYTIKYKEQTAYVCSDYVVDASLDAYDRPWTTPKKAIVGGAKFISRSYISKGQYTSYLKKFNVNPNAYYSVFSHQYMANLAAPSSEALTSSKAYTNNKLFELPLEFSIPVYLNMEESYNRPISNLAEIEASDEVTDEEFEKVLDEQQFPESYKRILRVLHTNHPNWIFKSLLTELDFATAVAAEKNVSSIQGNNAYFDLSSGQAIKTEPGWYLANDQTVAYYLDPRNFLTEKYILQFESLQYTENYTEEIVQTILDNTFMADLSVIDNQRYASIFVEAGKIADISPVYLASLAKQESGVNLGSNTNGAEFVYEDITYSGLFNFFNIGAYSSAANPSKAGLVYASGGYCTVCSANFVPTIPSIPDIPSLKELSITNLGLKNKNNYLVNIAPGTTANILKEKDDNVSFSSENIGTGTTITFADETSMSIVIYGDLSGDGIINSADLLKLRKHLLGTEPLTGAYLEASKISEDDVINSADLLRLRQYLLGTATISQE